MYSTINWRSQKTLKYLILKTVKPFSQGLISWLIYSNYAFSDEASSEVIHVSSECTISPREFSFE